MTHLPQDIKTNAMIKIIKRGERKAETSAPVKTQPKQRGLPNSTAEFSNTVKVWIEQFRRQRQIEAQRTFRSLFRES